MLIFVLLSACQGGLFNPPTATPIPSPTPTPFPDTFEGKFDVGGYALYIKCKGSGSPTIILEHGANYKSWDDVDLIILDSTTRTCLYYRAGISPSDPAAKTPVTTQDQVTDLPNLLLKAGVPGLYVLAGHSIAGFNLLLFTQLYPKEVVGLVCVDCRSPWMTQRTLDILGPEKDSDSEYLKSYRRDQTTPFYLFPDSIEKLDDVASEPQLQKITSLGGIPFIVLVASETGKDINLPTELNEKLQQV
jgi:pimeloyl-ACP methyl ester carboxylesterase